MKIRLLLFVLFFVGCTSKNINKESSNDNPLHISVAAGARFVSEEVCDTFEAKNKCKIERNYASSGTLARQIANGARVDVFISANKQWIDFLLEKGLLTDNSIQQIAQNSLVIVTPLDSKLDTIPFETDFDIVSSIQDKIVIGDPSYVPVGKYTKQVFDSLKWFEPIKEKTVMAKDVSSVLHLVELGECDWGVVYYSEAILSKKVKIVAKIPTSLHNPIYFYIANVKNGKSLAKELSQAFCDESGQKVFEKYGFKEVK